jgi:very-short-patch-repair endonuclease
MPRTRLPTHQRDLARRLRREMTDPERLLWGKLRAHRQDGLAVRRQVPMGPYVVDFACHAARLVVELDGGGHSWAGQSRRDAARDTWLADRGYRVLRFWNDEVMRNLDGVVETILAAGAEGTTAVGTRGGPPSLPSPARGEGLRRARGDRSDTSITGGVSR